MVLLSSLIEEKRECEMKMIRNRIAALLVVVALSYACAPLWISTSDPASQRRIDEHQSNLQGPLSKLREQAVSIDTSAGMMMEHQQRNKSSQVELEESPLQLAWLMSFPNSGTSYTMRMIARTTRTLVATNYQKRESSRNVPLVPVNGASEDEGPFWPDPEQSKYKPPPSFILTKTHCGSRCNDCGPSTYLGDFGQFEKKCASGSRHADNNDDDDEDDDQAIVVSYNTSQVAKAIHLIRNPFDNVVSRFHLERHRMIRANDTESLEAYPNSREGFRAYCKYVDDKWREEVESRWLSDEIGMLRSVPCRDDFFRYIVWHNLAFDTTVDQLRIPTYILHYEDYSQHFQDTVDNLLSFLDLKQAIPSPYPFKEGHSYHDYFTKEERQAVRQATKIISTNTTWDNVKHYFRT